MKGSFWLLIVGQAVSILGDAFGTLAVGWLVYDLTGSKLAMGSLFLATGIPEVIVRLLGAPLIDRYDRRRLMAGMDIIRAITYSLPPLLAATNHLELWHLYALSIVAGAAGALFRPALLAVVPSLVDGKALVRANALQNGVMQGASLLGPGLAGLVIAFAGANVALSVDALSFAISGVTLLMLPAVAGSTTGSGALSGSYVKQLAEGFQFFGKVRPLLIFMLFAACSNMGVYAVVSMTIPFVRDHLGAGPSAVGLFQMVWAIGFVIGTVVMGMIGVIPQRRLVLITALVVAGIANAGFALVKPGRMFEAMALQAIFGVAIAVYNVTIAYIYQQLVPDYIRGRAFTVRFLIVQGANSLGAFLGSALANVAGLKVMFLVAGLAPAAVIASGYLMPVLREVDVTVGAGPAETAAAALAEPDTAAVKKRSRRRRVLRATAWALVILLTATVSLGYLFVRRSLPQVSGTLRLPGLEAPVTVFRDNRGVAHIQASTAHDLYMAQGFVMAQDRLWQMDTLRRTVGGRLAEVMGPSVLETDKFFRTLQLHRAAERSVQAYSPSGRQAVEAFTAGVNAYIEQADGLGKLPPEFALLGYRPESWSPVDTAMVGKLIAYQMGGNWASEVFLYQLRQAVGDKLTSQVLPVYPSDGEIIVQHSGTDTEAKRMAMLPPEHGALDLSGLMATGVFPDPYVGSNNWVLSGNLTRSGKPLLANDPHLALQLPAIWYQTHLVLSSKDDAMNVIGATIPGVPGVVIGHNEQIAWGVTNTGPDVQDLYIERRNPANPHQFEYQNVWEEATIYQERIRVKGRADVNLEVAVTRHGPIISEIAGGPSDRPREALALKWTAFQPTGEVEAILQFGKARDWASFREALRKFQAPTMNFVFASQDGTIAYRANGLIPVRSKGQGLMPVPGWDGEHEWTAFIPFDELPEVVNPSQGFIVTANNKVVDDAYPYFLSNSWAPPYRAKRIREVLQSKASGWTAEEMQALQVDALNLQAASLVPGLISLVENASLTTAEKQGLDLLKAWDFTDRADSGAPFIHYLWRINLARRLFESKMGPDLYKRMTDRDNVVDEMIRGALKGDVSDWVQEGGGLEALAAQSFRDAMAAGAAVQGPDPTRWSWGKFHLMGPQHPLAGAIPVLGQLLNTKEYPVDGGPQTVGVNAPARTGRVNWSAAWRQVVDVAGMNGRDVLSPGQSGHFLSSWYEDQLSNHAQGQLESQLFTPEAFRHFTKLSLEP